MASRKLPSNEELEELLKLAEKDDFSYETPKEEALAHKLDDTIRFLTTFNIQPGDNYVRKSALYQIYRKWSHSPIGVNKFATIVGSYIPFSTKGPHTYYRVNLKASELSIEVYKNIEDTSIDKNKSKNWRVHFENFLNKFSITKGTYWIESYMLYYLYDKWTYEIKRKNCIGYNQFVSFLDVYFEHKRKTADRVEWYKIDINILEHLPIKKQREIRKARKIKYGKTKKGRKKVTTSKN